MAFTFLDLLTDGSGASVRRKRIPNTTSQPLMITSNGGHGSSIRTATRFRTRTVELAQRVLKWGLNGRAMRRNFRGTLQEKSRSPP
jgi:hypothetical protein